MTLRAALRATTAFVAAALGVLPVAAQTPPKGFVPRINPGATSSSAPVEIQDGSGTWVPLGTLNPSTHAFVPQGQADVAATAAAAKTKADAAFPASSAGTAATKNVGTTTGTVADGSVDPIARGAAAAAAAAQVTASGAVPQSSVGQAGGVAAYGDSRFARFTPQMMPGCASAGSGGDDAACIQAAVSAAAQAYGASAGPNAGLVYFPYPSSGNYNICSAHIALPGGSSAIRLEGVAAGGSSIRIMPGCANPPSEVLYQPINTVAASFSRVTLDNLTLDGYGLSNYIINIQYAVGFSGHNTVLRNAAKGGSNLYIKGGYEIEFGSSNRIENVNDPGHVIYNTATDLPKFGLETYATDSNYSNLIVVDAQQAYVYQGNGGNNHFVATHGWGYASANSGNGGLQQDFRAQYAFQAKGNAQFLGAIADGYQTAGFFLQALTGVESGASVVDSYFFGMPAGTCGVLLDTGLQHATIVGNYLSVIPTPATYGVCPASGTIDASNIIFGNQGVVNSNLSLGPIGGDALSLSGFASGSGGQVSVTSSASAASLYLNAKGTGGINLQANGAIVGGFSAPASAVNRLAFAAATTGIAPQIKAVGSDTNVDLQLVGQGTGGIAMIGPVKHSIVYGLAAAGTTQATATTLSKDISVLSGVASGSGVLLTTNIGQRQEIFNRGVNALSVYPPSGAQIESGTLNAPVTLAAGAHATFECVTATQCYQGP